MRTKCAVCDKDLDFAPGSHGGIMCRACCKSYDKDAFKVDGVIGAIVWAAKRARRCERLRSEKRAKDDERDRSL